MPELPTSYAVLPNIPISSTAASTQRRNAAGGHGEQRRGESKGGGDKIGRNWHIYSQWTTTTDPLCVPH